jgi:hypothetical protein
VDTSDPAAKAAGEAWSAAGEKFVSALEKMLDKLKDNKESLDAANKSIADFIATQKQNLQKASQDNDLKKDVEAGEKKNEGLSYEDLNENIFTGKKGMIKNISKEVTVVSSILRDMAAIPGMEAEAKKYQDEVTKISADMGGLLDKKNSEIDKEELKKAADRLAEIPTLLAKKSEEIAKEDTANKEAAAIFVDALKSLEAAKTADQAYAEKAEKEKEKEKDWNQSAKDAIGFKGTVKMADTKGKKNPVVAEFQKQAINKFKDKIKDSEVFKKFSDGKFAGDGYFGPNTAKVVQGLKAGFGMDDETSDITDDLLDKIFSLKESYSIEESSTFGRIQSFSSFEVINEAKLKFDVDKFLTAVGEKGKEVEKKDLPTPGDLLKSMNKTVEDVYSNNKEGIDYILGKDFQPTEEGRKNFFDIFRIGWKDFSKLNDNQKKNTVAMGFKSVLAPAVGVEKNIGKDLVDIYLKAEKKA